MAHAAQLNALTAELVDSVFSHDALRSSAHPLIKSCKENAYRNLRYHRFGRTNQFAVHNTLEGLVEKFQVLNNDPLASTLDARLKDLATLQYRWKPEVLSLLLCLSDNPAAHSRLQDLANPKDPEPPPPHLSWGDIFGHDEPPSHSLAHADDDSAFGSSGNSVISNDPIVPTESQSSPGSAAAIGLAFQPRLDSLLVGVDESVLDRVANKFAWHDDDPPGEKKHITELQATRQVLFMLRGLPSLLFAIDRKTSTITPVNAFYSDHMSHSGFHDLLSSFAELGSKLSSLRSFSSSPVTDPVLRTFASAIEEEIRVIDEDLAGVEKQYCSGDGQVIVSLLMVHARVEADLRHLSPMNDAVTLASSLTKGSIHCLLDNLHDHTCQAHDIGDEATFDVLLKVFSKCLNTFLRPIHRWMVHGELGAGVELISAWDTEALVEPAMFWERKFSLISHDGRPAAPRCLLPVVPEIFASGKSVAFMKELGINLESPEVVVTTDTKLSIELQRDHDSAFDLLPFPVRLKTALMDWVGSKHQRISTPLCSHLLHHTGLWETVHALENLYLSRDGAIFQAFADTIFKRLDSGRGKWDDADAIENVAQSWFSEAEPVDPANIRAARTKSAHSGPLKTVATLTSLRLVYDCQVFYAVEGFFLSQFLHEEQSRPPHRHTDTAEKTGRHPADSSQYPWTIQNIIPRGTLRTYQRVFTFLLQLHRASSLLLRHRFRTIEAYNTKISVAPDIDESAAVPSTTNSSTQSQTLAQYLHHRLFHLIRTLQTYTTRTAIHQSSIALKKALSEATDVDGLVSAHATFISRLEQRCLFGQQVETARNALTRLLDLACAFVDVLAAMKGRRGANTLTATSAGAGDSVSFNRTAGLDSDIDFDSEDEKNGEDIENDGERVRATVDETPKLADPEAALARLRQMRTQYTHLLAITIANVRNAAREEGGEPAWEELCESLEWNM